MSSSEDESALTSRAGFTGARSGTDTAAAVLRPAKRALRLAAILIAGICTIVVLLIIALLLYLGLRPADRTLRQLSVISVGVPFRFGRPLIAYLPFVDYMAIDGSTLYAANTTQGIVAVIDARRNQVVATIPLGRVHGVAIDEKDGLGFASDSGTNSVDVFSLRADKELYRIPVDHDPDAIIYDRKLGLVYVACHDAGMGDAIAPGSGKVVSRVKLGGTAEYVAVDPETGAIFQNLMSKGEVAVVDPLEGTVAARYKLGPNEQPTGMALDGIDHRLFVTGLGRKLFVLNTLTGSVIARLPIGYGSDGVAYDPGVDRVYVANGFSASLTVIQLETADRYRILEDAPTHFMGHSVVVDPGTHHIFVDYFGRIAVYETRSSRVPQYPVGRSTR